MTTFRKGTSIDAAYIQPGDLIHMEFGFYCMTSIRAFNSMLNVVCAKTRTLWVFNTASKTFPVRTVCFILTTFKNKKYLCRCVRVNEDGALANSTVVTNLLVDKFSTAMENTGGDALWIN